MSQNLQDVPGFRTMVESLGTRNSGDLAAMRAQVKNMDTDDLISVERFIDDWAKAKAQTLARDTPTSVNVSTDDLNNTYSMLRQSVPAAAIEDMNDIISTARDARRLGNTEYMADLITDLDDFADDLHLQLFDSRMADQMDPGPIPMDAIRETTVPWQDVAHWERSQSLRRQAVSKAVIGANAHKLPRGVEGRFAQVWDYYHRGMRGVYEDMLNAPLNNATYSEFRARALDVLHQRDTNMRRLFQSSPDTLRQWDNIQAIERINMESLLDIRRGGLGSADDYADAVRRAHVQENADLARYYDELGLEAPPIAHAVDEYPISSSAFATTAGDLQEIVRIMKGNVGDMFRNTRNIDDATKTEMIQYLDDLRPAMNTARTLANVHGRTMRDWVALNYSQKYGLDGALALIFPYHFWIGRTVRDWTRLTMARPGMTAAFTRLYEGIAEINEQADVPDRVKSGIRLPMPFSSFFNGIFPGGEGSVYFDPIRSFYPLAGFSGDEFGPEPSTPIGQGLDAGSRVGFGTSPFITLALGATGIEDRDDYLRRGLSSFTSTPFGLPGPRVQRAIHDWVSGIAENPDPAVLTEDMKQRIAEGEPLTEGELKDGFAGVLLNLATAGGALPEQFTTDTWDEFRVDRTIAAMVAQDPNRWTPRAGLEAMRFRKGALYNEARKQAMGDKGLSILTGWLVMPVRLYPEGEQVQRGLDALWREVRATGDSDTIEQFFQQYPEYQVRTMAQQDRGGSPSEQETELDTDLYFLDLGEIRSQFEPRIDELRRAAEDAERNGYLTTKEGRRLLEIIRNDIDFLYQAQQEQIEVLDALYPNRRTELSLRASPLERGLFNLREGYYSIQRKDFATGEDFDAAREDYIARLPTDAPDPATWLQTAVAADRLWAESSDRLAANPSSAETIVAARDEGLHGLTASTQAHITQDLFRSYLFQSDRPRTAERVEYRQAVSEISAYFSIAEADGLTSDQKKSMQRQYWQSHPLLTKYFSNDEPVAWNAEVAAVFGRMDEIWNEYFAQDNDPVKERAYLGRSMGELNDLRRQVGLAPLRLIDWQSVMPDQFQQPATTPHETAIQRELQETR
jgi:hypothetical protein